MSVKGPMPSIAKGLALLLYGVGMLGLGRVWVHPDEPLVEQAPMKSYFLRTVPPMTYPSPLPRSNSMWSWDDFGHEFFRIRYPNDLFNIRVENIAPTQSVVILAEKDAEQLDPSDINSNFPILIWTETGNNEFLLAGRVTMQGDAIATDTTRRNGYLAYEGECMVDLAWIEHSTHPNMHKCRLYTQGYPTSEYSYQFLLTNVENEDYRAIFEDIIVSTETWGGRVDTGEGR